MERRAARAMSDRKARGAWYTPPELASALVGRALVGLEAGATIVDLACGDGALLAAARRVGDFRLIGFDIDPNAVRAAQQRIPEADIRCADGLTAEVPTPQAVVGNPPFLFGALRPAVDTRYFTLAKGQWDTAWLFLERGLSLLNAGGRLGYVLPDSVLARHETMAVRRLVRERIGTLHIRHDPPRFTGAHVATVLLTGTVRTGSDTSAAQTTTLEMGDQVYHLQHDASWPPPPPVPAGWGRIGDLVHISRGEELGKRHLSAMTGDRAELAPGGVPILSGAGVVPLGQPQPTHWVHTSALKKPPAQYASPKVVVVKTGKVVCAGVDSQNLVTLQSVYNLRPHRPGLAWARFLCGVLSCSEVQRRFVLPHTSGKKVFPQITQTLLSQIRIPPLDDAVVKAVAAAVAAEDPVVLELHTRAWFGTD